MTAELEARVVDLEGQVVQLTERLDRMMTVRAKRPRWAFDCFGCDHWEGTCTGAGEGFPCDHLPDGPEGNGR